MEINDLPVNAAPTSELNIELSDGQRATLASLPIQSAVTNALALKAPLASPALTGTPTAPTAATTTSTTQLATTAFVQQELLAGGSTSRSLVVSVRNQSGGTMAAGTVVYINGATGNLPTIAKAIATSDATSAQTIGLVQTSIANNGSGLVIVRGIAGNLDTSALTEGQQLYLSPTTAGTYTTTKQFAPNHLVYVGIVTRAHPTQGSIEVAVQNGFEMDELHNVSAQSPTNGDTLRWNSSTSLWEKSALGTLATQSGTFTDKANLASPTFTGNPLAPTPATTDSDTSIATTAMVQAVANAQWTQPTAIAITAAGNSNVAAATAQNRYLTQRVNVTAFTGTATVTLQNTSAIAGDKRRLIVAMPAGFANLIELRNLTSGGTLLATVPMDGALARTWLGYSTFDGTNWGAVSFSPMSVDEFVLARTAFRGDYPNSDGATSNRAAGIYGPFDATNNPREWVAGAASLTIAAVLTVPTSGLSASTEICTYSPATNNPAQAFGLRVLLRDLGNLQIAQLGASGYSTLQQFESASTFRATYSGQTGLLKIYFVQGTTDPVVSWNGVNISSSFTRTTAGTPPAWLDAAMVPTYRLVGYNWPAGPAPIVTPILGQTSAADDAFYMATGKWPAWVVAGGSAAVQYTSSFAVDAHGWSDNTGGSCVVAGNIDAIAGVDDVLRVSRGTFGALQITRGAAFDWITATRFIEIKFDYYLDAASGITGVHIGAQAAPASATLALTEGSWVSNAVVTSNTYVTGNRGLSGIGTLGVGKNLYLKNIRVKHLGALSLPSVQPINVIDDVSLLGGNQGRLLGCTAVTDKTNWRISANTWTSGNQQILAGSILDSTKHIIDQVEQSTTGTPTTTIGSASAGSQYKASSALTAGINPTTLVTRKLASNDVWVNSNSTAVVRTTITGHIAT